MGMKRQVPQSFAHIVGYIAAAPVVSGEADIILLSSSPQWLILVKKIFTNCPRNKASPFEKNIDALMRGRFVERTLCRGTLCGGTDCRGYAMLRDAL